MAKRRSDKRVQDQKNPYRAVDYWILMCLAMSSVLALFSFLFAMDVIMVSDAVRWIVIAGVVLFTLFAFGGAIAVYKKARRRVKAQTEKIRKAEADSADNKTEQ